MSGVGSRTNSGTPSSFESLVPTARFGRKSATAAAMITTSASSAATPDRLLHVCRGLHVDSVHRGGHVLGQRQRRRRDQGHRGTPPGRRDGQGVTLLARGPVRDEAHRVDRFTSASRAHHDVQALQVATTRVVPRRSSTRPTMTPGSASRPFARVASRQPATLGRDDLDAALARAEPRLSRTEACSHISVCMAGQMITGRAGREQGRAQEIVGQARGIASDRVRGGRHHHDEISILAKPGVRDRRRLVPQRPLDRLRRQRGERHCTHEPRGVLGQHGGHVDAGVNQPAADLDGLVRSDAAAHAQNDTRTLGGALLGGHWGTRVPVRPAIGGLRRTPAALA